MVLADPSAVVVRLAAREDGARLLRTLEAERGVHLVGGAVRDLLLGLTPREIDLVAEEDGAGVADRLAAGVGRRHARFGTASLETEDGLPIDVATARAEDYPSPGALPVVRPGTLEQDMARRDFTVNAIAVGLSPDRRGQVHQADGALRDLGAGVLRVLHDRSFADDPTRLVRMARYAARLGFEVDPHTVALARAAIESGAPATAGEARMGADLQRLLAESPPVAIAGLLLLRDLGLYRELDIDADLMARAVALLPEGARHDLLLLATLGHRVGDPRGWLGPMHVKAPGPVFDALVDPEGLAQAMRAAAKPSDLWRVLRRRTDEAVALAGAVGAEDAARRWFGELRDVRLRIRGEDLVQAGVAPGPEIGRRLQAALVRKLDEGAATREDELAFALGSEA